MTDVVDRVHRMHPGHAAASLVSIEVMRAWAKGLRTKAAWSMPLRVMSST
jgi:hypothetical protein